MGINILPRIKLFALLLIASSAGAHHNVGDDMDIDNPLTLQGSISHVEWINPHVVIHFESIDDRGLPQLWLVQADTPNSLLRRGLNRNSFQSMNNAAIMAFPSQANNCLPDCFAYGLSINDSRGTQRILSQDLQSKTTELRPGQ